MSTVIDTIERAQLRRVPDFRAGDRLRVHFIVIEGTRRRTQVFEGVAIKRQGQGVRETFTVRKQSFGVGVERTFPLHSPKIERIEVAARGDVRRAKLYYLRDRVGKAARVRERGYVGPEAAIEPGLLHARAQDGETLEAETPDAETVDVETADAEMPDAETLDVETADAEMSDHDTPGAEVADAERPDTDTPGAESLDAEEPKGDDATQPEAPQPDDQPLSVDEGTIAENDLAERAQGSSDVLGEEAEAASSEDAGAVEPVAGSPDEPA